MIFNATLASEIAEKLLQINAIKLNPQNPFTWTSGWKSPIYCDNRKTLAYPDIRNHIKKGFANIVTQHFKDADAIAGVATAGIAHGALLADELEMPFAYVRATAKGHGLQNLIEGKIDPGQKVVVVEDLISTGKSSIAAVQALKEAGAEVLGLVAIFTYGFQIASDQFENEKIPFYTLSDYDHLIEKAVSNGDINKDLTGTLMNWRKDPSKWNVF